SCGRTSDGTEPYAYGDTNTVVLLRSSLASGEVITSVFALSLTSALTAASAARVAISRLTAASSAVSGEVRPLWAAGRTGGAQLAPGGVERGERRPAIGVENVVGCCEIARGRANGITFAGLASVSAL